MKQVLIKSGTVTVAEIPAPNVEPGTILIRVHYSCISSGTELSGIKASAVPVWEKAWREPEKVQKLLRLTVREGVAATKAILTSKLGAARPTGYSAAGVVVAIGAGIDDLKPGDRVAAAGAQCAFHAGLICVPRNLATLIPETVALSDASTTTIGAIALQGLRRANPTLGECFIVIGLGVLGQLTVQLLKANGCRVYGAEPDQDRINRALNLGLDGAIWPQNGDEVSQIKRLTNGNGADGVIITAATPSHEIVATAFKMCRKKGRVVLVGDVGLNLNRDDFYQKELDFLISASCGPGRYESDYEEKGLDYPLAFVRWTENRNMGEYLRLLQNGQVKVGPLIDHIYPLDRAKEAYGLFNQKNGRPMLILLAYPALHYDPEVDRKVTYCQIKPGGGGQIKMGVIGAGNFAKGIHLPNLKSLARDYRVQAIMSRTGHSAAASAKLYGAQYATTDYHQILTDSEIDAVLIATRHNLHATLALAALKAGKHVLVEKPLALNQSELAALDAFYRSQEGKELPMLLTGYNRRFSVYARRIKELVQTRTNPMIINYRLNAGYLPLESWERTEAGGGRNLGEACHIYDLFTFLTESQIKTVTAVPISPTTGYYARNDNFVATLAFNDGSVATLTYTALGSENYPKERMEVYVDGKVIVLDDYQQLLVYGDKPRAATIKKGFDKGHRAELAAFAAAIKAGEWAIPWWQQLQTANIAFEVEKKLQ